MSVLIDYLKQVLLLTYEASEQNVQSWTTLCQDDKGKVKPVCYGNEEDLYTLFRE